MVYKFETLKRKAIEVAVGSGWENNWKLCSYALVAGIGDNTLNWKKNANELQELIIKRIEQWDIRMVKTLVDLFPSIISKKCFNQKITCYQTDVGWVVEFY